MILEAGNSVEYLTGGWRAFRPVRGEAECIHCFQCWLFCPDSSILVDAENEKMVGFDLEHCKGCGICAAGCPQRAIDMMHFRDRQVLAAIHAGGSDRHLAAEGR